MPQKRPCGSPESFNRIRVYYIKQGIDEITTVVDVKVHITPAFKIGLFRPGINISAPRIGINPGSMSYMLQDDWYDRLSCSEPRQTMMNFFVVRHFKPKPTRDLYMV